MEARLLGVVDRYGSMITPREYREAGSVPSIMRYFLNQKQGEYDHQIGKVMISVIGLYPPGMLLRLQSGETAVVTRRSKNRLHPLVQAICAGEGDPYGKPVERDTEDEAYRIVSTTQYKGSQKLNADLLWGHGGEDQPLFREKTERMAVLEEKDDVTLF